MRSDFSIEIEVFGNQFYFTTHVQHWINNPNWKPAAFTKMRFNRFNRFNFMFINLFDLDCFQLGRKFVIKNLCFHINLLSICHYKMKKKYAKIDSINFQSKMAQVFQLEYRLLEFILSVKLWSEFIFDQSTWIEYLSIWIDWKSSLSNSTSNKYVPTIQFQEITSLKCGCQNRSSPKKMNQIITNKV